MKPLQQVTQDIIDNEQANLSLVPAARQEPEHVRVYLDFETTMRTDINDVGAAKFLEDNEPTYIAWAVDNGEIKCEEWSGTAQGNLVHDINQAEELVAHNMPFDYMCLLRFLDPANLAKLQGKRLACTKAMSLRLNHHPKLLTVCENLGIGEKLEMPTALAPKEDWIEYNKQDVWLCRKLYRKFRKAISNMEMRVIHNATMMNVRGVQLDGEHFEKVCQQEMQELEVLENRFRTLTGLGRRQHEKLGKWFEKRTGKRTSKYKILSALNDKKFSQETKDAIKLLTKCNEKEVDKFKAIKRSVNKDWRLRDTLQVNSTITNRWAGAGAHLQNAKRGGLTRSFVVAGKGKRLFVADLAQVEVRVGLWYAGMLDACKDIDERDWYMDIAKEIYGNNADKECRRRVKQGVIGAMYAGGVKALATGINGTMDEAQYLYDKCQEIFAPITNKSKELFEAAIECVKSDDPEDVELHSGFKVSFRTNANGTLIMKLPFRKTSIYYHEAELNQTRRGSQITYKNAYGGKEDMQHRGMIYEHVCSTTCRELFVEVQTEADGRDGIDSVYTMHDELLAELDEARSSELATDILAIMKNAGKELTGLRLNAEGEVKERWANT